MDLSRSRFYAWRQREHDEQRQCLHWEVKDIHDQKSGSYGSRRMAQVLGVARFQRVGIVEIDLAHRPLQHQGAYLAGQRVANAQRMTRIDPVVIERLNHTAAVVGGALTVELNADCPVAGQNPGVGLSPIADGSLGSGSWQNTLILQEYAIRHLRFQAGLINKAGSIVFWASIQELYLLPDWPTQSASQSCSTESSFRVLQGTI